MITESICVDLPAQPCGIGVIKQVGTNGDYLRQQLEWGKYRAKALEEIEAGLREM